MKRHRWVGHSIEQPCAEAFGGVARCALPYENGQHWSDEQHPFKPAPVGSGCGWRRQTSGAAFCDEVRGSLVHHFPGDEEAKTEYPAAQPETVVGKDGVQQQRYGYPPDEDSVPRGRPKLTLEVLDSGPVSQEVDAVVSLRGDGRVMGGPWPVRRYRLADEGWSLTNASGDPTSDDKMALRGCLQALDALGETYVLAVWRPIGEAWRWALVTWGAMRGEDAGDCAEQIALDYDVP